jgi:hypothetical protein
MEERTYQGPYAKTLEQATEIVSLVTDYPAGIVYDKKDSKQYTGSAKAIDVCDDFEVKAYYVATVAARLARWMDALPTNVRYVFVYRNYSTWHAYPVTTDDGG